MKLMQCMSGGYSSSARVVGDTLVLSLPDARSPIVWRMELGEIKAAAFEVRQEDKSWVLTMKTPKGDAQEIAPYDTKAQALKALMAASRAMEQASAKPVSYANDAGRPVAAPPPRKKGQLAAGIIGVAILGVLIYGITQAGPKTPHSPGSSAATSSPSAAMQEGFSGKSAPGVPVSADDFLRNR